MAVSKVSLNKPETSRQMW